MKLLYIKPWIAGLLAISLLSACAVVPKFSEGEVPANCEVFTKSVELDFVGATPDDMGHFDCGNADEACAVIALVALGVLTTTFIVSGSVYVVGNSAHWLEKQGRCDSDDLEQEIQEFADTMSDQGGEQIEPENIVDAQTDEVF